MEQQRRSENVARNSAKQMQKSPPASNSLQGLAVEPGIDSANVISELSRSNQAEMLVNARSNERRSELAMQLQRSHGNAYVQALLSSKVVQAKLRVSQPEDASEREADAVSGAENLERRINTARGTGQFLDHTARAALEPHFGHDFSQVKVHADAEADNLNRELAAEAFTTGSDIFFSQGSYDPDSKDGRRLIAHELTHVVQQRNTVSDAVHRHGGHGGAPGHTHTAEERTQSVLQGAARILGIPNFISPSINQMTAVEGVPLPAAERYMLFEFWLAVAGREVQAGQGASGYRRATTEQRVARITHGNETAQTVIGQLGPAPWPGRSGEAVRTYQDAYSAARGRIMEEAVSAELESRPTPTTYEAPEFELEQQRLAIGQALAALRRFELLAARQTATTAARFSPEIRQALTEIAARAPAGSRLAGIESMGIPEAITTTRGILNGLNAVLQIADAEQRQRLLASQLNVRDVTSVHRVLLGLAEGLVATTSLIGAGVTRAIGNTALSTRLYRLGTGPVVRTISMVASLVQMVHGIAVLADERATESDRLQGVYDVAMGAAGLTGAAASLGVEALAGISGPASAGIVITAAEIVYLRSLIRGFEEGATTAGIVQSYSIVEYEAGGVAHEANELAEAMAYTRERGRGGPAPGQPGELAAAADREVEFRSRRLREFLVRAIDRVTQRQPEFAILFQPASWPQIRTRFESLRAPLGRATTPNALLQVAASYLTAARDLFRNLARTIALSLQGIDRERAGGVLPHILGGLHDVRGAEAGGRSRTLEPEQIQ